MFTPQLNISNKQVGEMDTDTEINQWEVNGKVQDSPS
jgi:hypothetical protein